ncbi:MAG: hypothetical protein GY842_18300 [bacterium]|nr:hypothetical protein [bacterium]
MSEQPGTHDDEVLSDDISDTWMVGEEPPAGGTLSPVELPEGPSPSP